jgi:ER lumen protein retaining receptor
LNLFIFLNKNFLFKILWTFSIYLESVAILPQLYMVTATGEAETITSHYLFALGIYRLFYILNWIYRYHTENVLDWISIVSGVIQTILYCDFFYLYITRGRKKYFLFFAKI